VIVCSCAIISDRDIETAVREILCGTPSLLPTPGVVFRHLKKRMNCCTCAPLAVATIYAAMQRLENDTHVCPFALNSARARLADLDARRVRREMTLRARRSENDPAMHAAG